MEIYIGPIIWEIDWKAINQNADDKVSLTLEHDIEMWDKLT